MPLDPNISLAYQPPQIQSPLQAIGQVQALKNQQLQSQLVQGEVLQQQRQLQAQQLLASAYSNSIVKNPDGTTSFDPDKLQAAVVGGGRGDLWPDLQQSLLKVQTSQADLTQKRLANQQTAQALQQAQNDHGGMVGVALQDAEYDPAMAYGQARLAHDNGNLTDAQYGQIVNTLQANPTQQTVKSIADGLIQNSKAAQQFLADRAQKKAETQSKQLANTQQLLTQATANLAGAPPPDSASYAQAVSKLDPQTAMTILRALPAGQYDPQTAPAILRKLGMTPEQQQTAAQAQAQQAETARHNKVDESQALQRIGIERIRANAETEIARLNQGDREIRQLGQPFQLTLTGAQNQMQRISEAQNMLANASPEQQALAIPGIVSGIIGGQGSGVRVTQPELNSIVAARGLGGDFQAWKQKLIDGKKLTPDQSKQLLGVLADVATVVGHKMDATTQTLQSIESAPDRPSRIAAAQRGRGFLNSTVSGTAAVPANVQAVLQNAAPGIHKLSDGSSWMKGADGTITKQ